VTVEVKAHETNTSMVKAALAELDAGTDFGMKVRLSCPHACDLRGSIIRIVAQDGTVVKEIELLEFDGTVNETDEFAVKAPIKPGEYTWTAVFPAQEKGDVLHEESSKPRSFTVKPHATSMAVWDVPSPIVFGDKFKIRVGVRCSAECKLMGKKIEIYDQEGGKVATETLGGVPWPTTSALYWVEVELEAPSIEGCYRWTVKFPKPDLELPHEGASYTFAFVTARPPEHVVTVEVIDKATKTPLKDAGVFLNPNKSYTDEHGVASVMVPKGGYELYVSKYEYEEFQTTIEVAGDVTVKTELVFCPEFMG
jgi:hypothetical protein